MRASKTASQKRYEAACEACRAWAASTPAHNLLVAENNRVARSYGVKPADALSIITNARRERSL